MSSPNSSTRLSFLKMRLWLRGKRVFCLYLSTSVLPNSSRSTHSLKSSRWSLTSNNFSLSTPFSLTRCPISRSLRSSRKTYLASSCLQAGSFLLGDTPWNSSKEFLAWTSDFSPTDFFICSLTRLTSCSFFLISCKICSFLVLNIPIIFLSSSRSFLPCTSLRRLLFFRSELSFSTLPSFLLHSSRLRLACSMQLRYFSFQKLMAAMSSLALLLNCKSLCLNLMSSTRQRRVCSLSCEQGSSPRGKLHPASTEREQALCSVNQFSSFS